MSKRSGMVLLLVVGCIVWLAACNQQNQTPGKITGGVFCDCNKDGECDQNEEGINNVTVRLYMGACGEQLYETTTTDAQGQFAFTGLEPGDYCVFPDLDPVCGGYAGNFPTSSINRNVTVDPGETTDLLWFGYTIYVEGE